MALSVALANFTSLGFQGAGIRTYTTVPGFFLQDNLTATGIPAIPPSFGLLDQSPDRWSKFFAHIKSLNKGADRYTSYKAFFLSRHGQGFHNVAESKYGTPLWDSYWSKLNTDGNLTWGPDAEITPTGVVQAGAARQAWKTELAAKIPVPTKFYVSPLSRALKTLEITFDGLVSKHYPTKPLVVENLREIIGVHTCDRRRSKTFIKKTYPYFKIEHGFTEEDQLWLPDVRETDAHIAGRAKKVLDLVFENDEEDIFISVTGHGGIIGGFMTAVGRPGFGLATGGILPIVVKSVYKPHED